MKPTFTRLDQATPQDMLSVVNAMQNYSANQLAKTVLNLLVSLKEDTAFSVDRLTHSLQTATLAQQAGADEETVTIALLHDIGEVLSPWNHAEVVAAMLQPYISEDNYWLLKHHEIFQRYHYADKLGGNKNEREQFRGHPMFEKTALFCEKWDNPAFDPNFKALPLSAFEPLVHKLFAKEPKIVTAIKAVQNRGF